MRVCTLRSEVQSRPAPRQLLNHIANSTAKARKGFSSFFVCLRVLAPEEKKR